jgi:hypothetical protein
MGFRVHPASYPTRPWRAAFGVKEDKTLKKTTGITIKLMT